MLLCWWYAVTGWWFVFFWFGSCEQILKVVSYQLAVSCLAECMCSCASCFQKIFMSDMGMVKLLIYDFRKTMIISDDYDTAISLNSLKCASQMLHNTIIKYIWLVQIYSNLEVWHVTMPNKSYAVHTDAESFQLLFVLLLIGLQQVMYCVSSLVSLSIKSHLLNNSWRSLHITQNCSLYENFIKQKWIQSVKLLYLKQILLDRKCLPKFLKCSTTIFCNLSILGWLMTSGANSPFWCSGFPDDENNRLVFKLAPPLVLAFKLRLGASWNLSPRISIRFWKSPLRRSSCFVLE